MDWHPLAHWLTGNRLSRRIADAAFARYSRRRMARLDALALERIQQRTLLDLVRRAEQTRFGQDHDFPRICSLDDYQRLVPLRDYEQFWNQYWKASYPYLAGSTWPDPVPYFALSSGTTSGTTKYIPVTWEMVRSNRKAAATLLAGFVNSYPQAGLLRGRMFFLGGSTDLQQVGMIEKASAAADGRRTGSALRRQVRERLHLLADTVRPRAKPLPILAGDLSGIAAREVPEVLRPYSFPPPDLAWLTDWEEKVRRMAEQSADLPITLISGVPSWLLVLFARLREVTGRATIAEIWPTLRLLIHGGVKFDPYRETMRRVVGSPQVRFLECYPCSEGFVAFEDPRYDLLRLIPDHGIFFEFVPVEDLGSARPTRHTATQVEIGVQYAVVLTTCAGLWSYVVGDTVAFERRNPPLLRFTGRTRYFLSAFGEHLISEEVEKAVAEAARVCQAEVTDFHVGPRFPEQPQALGRHVYLVEFGKPPDRLERFAEEIDRQLCRLNEDYLAHRRGDVGMAGPLVRQVKPGGFAAWLRSRGQLGGQHKVPRMDNSGHLTSEIEAWLARSGLLE
ncbi:MAG: GH3 auxin-responsive promoter family protein [Gemmatales bacterium]|nr:GH3 auxin-responsive promoter family protein [Gemmatales bacterium]MDW8388469.1 GH3 auxin-responsive promoter family protein [Gemmatales bacterium]